MDGYASRAAFRASAIVAVVAVVAIVCGVVACGAFDEAASDGPAAGSDGGDDARVEGGGTGALDGGSGDGGVAPGCDSTGTFTKGVMITGTAGLETARPAADDLVYLTIPSAQASHLGTATLANDALSAPMPLFATTSDNDEQPTVSPGGLVLVFDSFRKTTAVPAALKLWIATRANTASAWDAPVVLAVAGVTSTDNSGLQDAWIGKTHIYFVEAANGATQHHLRSGTLNANAKSVSAVNPAFTTPEPIVDHPVLSADELELFFFQAGKVLHAVRSSADVPFKDSKEVKDLGFTMVATDVKPTWLSPDGCELYYFAQVADGDPTTSLFKTTRRR